MATLVQCPRTDANQNRTDEPHRRPFGRGTSGSENDSRPVTRRGADRENGVTEGIRTPDIRDHNAAL